MKGETAVRLNKECVGDYALSYGKDLGRFFTAPARWKKRQWLVNTSLLAMGGSLFIFDEWINDQLAINRFNPDFVQYGAKNFGNGFYTMPLMGGMFLYGLVKDDSKAFQTSMMGVKSFVLSTLITRTLKYSLNRERPAANLGSNFWNGPSNPFGTFSESELSFPSGHTTGAFAVATVLAKNYKDKLWVPITAYGIAGFVGYTRIHQGEHWASDVFFGALVGYAVGSIVTEATCSGNESAFKFTGSGIAYNF